GAVGSAQIAAGAVGATQLAAGAVGAAQIADGSISGIKLAAGSVGATQMAGGSVGFAQLAKPPQAGALAVDPLESTVATVSFPQAYATAPVVTFTASNSPETLNPTATLISTSATGFTASVRAQIVAKPVGNPGVSGSGASVLALGGNP